MKLSHHTITWRTEQSHGHITLKQPITYTSSLHQGLDLPTSTGKSPWRIGSADGVMDGISSISTPTKPNATTRPQRFAELFKIDSKVNHDCVLQQNSGYRGAVKGGDGVAHWHFNFNLTASTNPHGCRRGTCKR